MFNIIKHILPNGGEKAIFPNHQTVAHPKIFGLKQTLGDVNLPS